MSSDMAYTCTCCQMSNPCYLLTIFCKVEETVVFFCTHFYSTEPCGGYWMQVIGATILQREWYVLWNVDENHTILHWDVHVALSTFLHWDIRITLCLFLRWNVHVMLSKFLHQNVYVALKVFLYWDVWVTLSPPLNWDVHVILSTFLHWDFWVTL